MDRLIMMADLLTRYRDRQRTAYNNYKKKIKNEITALLTAEYKAVILGQKNEESAKKSIKNSGAAKWKTKKEFVGDKGDLPRDDR